MYKNKETLKMVLKCFCKSVCELISLEYLLLLVGVSANVPRMMAASGAVLKDNTVYCDWGCWC